MEQNFLLSPASPENQEAGDFAVILSLACEPHLGCYLSLPLAIVVVITIITSVLSLNKMMALMTFSYMFITCFAQSVWLGVSADPLWYWGTGGLWRVPGPRLCWEPPKLVFIINEGMQQQQSSWTC